MMKFRADISHLDIECSILDIHQGSGLLWSPASAGIQGRYICHEGTKRRKKYTVNSIQYPVRSLHRIPNTASRFNFVSS